MPIYEYRCKDCGAISEFIVFGSDDELYCKSCKSLNLEKLMSVHNTRVSGNSFDVSAPGGCCGSPSSCGSPGSCCSG